MIRRFFGFCPKRLYRKQAGRLRYAPRQTPLRHRNFAVRLVATEPARCGKKVIVPQASRLLPVAATTGGQARQTGYSTVAALEPLHYYLRK